MRTTIALIIMCIICVSLLPAEVLQDTWLEQAALQQLGLDPDERITKEDLLQLESITSRSSNIESLEGLQYALNLKELDLRNNLISDLSPLQDLKNLKSLNIRENPNITNLSPLAGLKQLEYLNINLNTSITSIAPLSSLPNLDTLLMRSVPVLHLPEEQAVLVELGPLDRLNARDTGLNTVTVLLPGLKEGGYSDLDIQENPIEDMHLLSSLQDEIKVFSPAGPRFSGRARLSLGTMLSLASYERNIIEELSLSALYDIDLRLSVEYQPASSLKVFAAVDAEFSESKQDISSPEIDQLYLLWKPSPSVDVSAGKQKQDWGEDFLIETEGDFAEDLDDGFSLYVLSPYLSGFILGKQNYFSDTSLPKATEAAYALRYAYQNDLFNGSLQVRYRHNSSMPLRTSLAASFNLTDTITLRGQTTSSWDISQFPEGTGNISAGVSWKDAWNIQGEYLYDNIKGHFIAAELTPPQVFGFSPEVKAYHHVDDSSGLVELMLKKPVFNHFLFTISMPVSYGPEGSHYRVNSDIPGDHAAALKAEISARIRW